MRGRARAVKVKIPLSKDKNIAEMFQGMLGGSEVSLGIAWPRYKCIKEHVDKLLLVLSMFNNSVFMRAFDVLAPNKVEIEQFITEGRKEYDAIFSIDLTEYEWNLDLVSGDDRTTFIAAYDIVKKSPLINSFIIMCDRLVTYKRYIKDQSSLDSRFLTSMSGAEFCPFPFTGLNYKFIFGMSDVSENTKMFLMSVLHKLFDISYKLYHEVTSPDIDIDEFAEFIITSLKTLQKRPELNRCNRAFSKIVSSVEMLKENFNGYYRDFICTKNSTIIMEHFVADVAKGTDHDPQTTREFNVIIKYCRKMFKDRPKDARLDALFNSAQQRFDSLERGTTNLGTGPEVEIKEDGDAD